MQALQRIVEEAYSVFSIYKIVGRLTVCNCNVCMSPETERALTGTALREVPSALLAEYTNSAHGYDEGDIATELRYFLPRYFELIAADDPPDHMGLDQCLRRLGESAYRTRWPAREVELIDAFFDECVIATTTKLEMVEWPIGWLPASDVLDIITMALTAGGEAERLMKAMEKAPDPGAAVHMASLRRHLLQTEDGHVLQSSYLEGQRYERAVKLLGRWLAGADVSARIQAAFFMVDDSRLQEILSKEAW